MTICKKNNVTILNMIKNNLSMLMGKKRIKICELARLTGLNYNTILNVYYEKTKGIEYDTLNKICWALECNTQELLEYVPEDL